MSDQVFFVVSPDNLDATALYSIAEQQKRYIEPILMDDIDRCPVDNSPYKSCFTIPGGFTDGEEGHIPTSY